MKAIRFHEFGGPEVLHYEDVELPTPGAGEARVRVAASAFNAADSGMRAGFLPIPGRTATRARLRRVRDRRRPR